MTYDRDFFTPENVDEQVDEFSQYSRGVALPPNEQAEVSAQAGAQLVGDLKAYYQIEQQEDVASLARAWKQISARLPGDHRQPQSISPQSLSIPISRISQERTRKMQDSVHDASRKGRFSRQLRLLVAVLVSVLLVGGLAVVLNVNHQKSLTSTPVQKTPTPTATATPAPVWGKTLYTTPPNQYGTTGLSWSPNSQRIAAVANFPGSGVQFWDATTGDHLVTTQLPDGMNEVVHGLDWSPNSEDVAIATNKHLLLVNGQTGDIVSSDAPTAPTASSVTSSSQLHLSSGDAPTAPTVNSVTSSSQLPLSSRIATGDGSGYRATAWSPDGHLIAVARSYVSYGEVQVWDPQNAATNFILSMGGSYNVGSVAWSFDGKYIAANVWDTHPTDMGNPMSGSMMVVWSLSTHQVVFQHNGTAGSDIPMAWQPHTHSLAFNDYTASNGKYFVKLEIWDVMTGRLIKQYSDAPNTNALAWSPDGTYLAYPGSSGDDGVAPVIIVDVTTDKQVYVYKGLYQSVGLIAWSPNGQYIASSGGNTKDQPIDPRSQTAVVAVWTA